MDSQARPLRPLYAWTALRYDRHGRLASGQFPRPQSAEGGAQHALLRLLDGALLGGDVRTAASLMAVLLREFRAFPAAVFDGVLRLLDAVEDASARVRGDGAGDAAGDAAPEAGGDSDGDGDGNGGGDGGGGAGRSLRRLRAHTLRALRVLLSAETQPWRALVFTRAWLSVLVARGQLDEAAQAGEELLQRAPFAGDAACHALVGAVALWRAKAAAGVRSLAGVRVHGRLAAPATQGLGQAGGARRRARQQDGGRQARPSGDKARAPARSPSNVLRSEADAGVEGEDEDEEDEEGAGVEGEVKSEGKMDEATADALATAALEMMLGGASSTAVPAAVAASPPPAPRPQATAAGGKRPRLASPASSRASDVGGSVDDDSDALGSPPPVLHARAALPRAAGGLPAEDAALTRALASPYFAPPPPSPADAVALSLSSAAVHVPGSVEELLVGAERHLMSAALLAAQVVERASDRSGNPPPPPGIAHAFSAVVATHLSTAAWLAGRPEDALAVCRRQWRAALRFAAERARAAPVAVRRAAVDVGGADAVITLAATGEALRGSSSSGGGGGGGRGSGGDPRGSAANAEDVGGVWGDVGRFGGGGGSGSVPLLVAPSLLGVLRHAAALYAVLATQEPRLVGLRGRDTAVAVGGEVHAQRRRSGTESSVSSASSTSGGSATRGVVGRAGSVAYDDYHDEDDDDDASTTGASERASVAGWGAGDGGERNGGLGGGAVSVGAVAATLRMLRGVAEGERAPPALPTAASLARPPPLSLLERGYVLALLVRAEGRGNGGTQGGGGYVRELTAVAAVAAECTRLEA